MNWLRELARILDLLGVRKMPLHQRFDLAFDAVMLVLVTMVLLNDIGQHQDIAKPALIFAAALLILWSYVINHSRV